MTRVLYCGDPHARPDCLEEMGRLVEYIYKVAKENKVEYILLTGDQFHTHSMVHLSVLGFWNWAFSLLSQVAPVYALVGNHDRSGVSSDVYNAMMLFSPDIVTVVSEPMTAPWGALLMPYYPEDAYPDFIERCNKDPAKLVVCHQTFTGAQYDNGFYAKDGIDPNLIKQDWIISGHVHTPQKIVMSPSRHIWYPGSPRWQTISDANTQRAIWVLDHIGDDTINGMVPFDTAGVCKPIYLLEDREEAPAELPSIPGNLCIDVYGSPEYVTRRKTELEAKGVRVRPFPDNNRVMKVRESDGLPLAFKKFLVEHKTKYGTSPDRLMELASKKVSWLKAEAA